jgi:hypothetical protein
VHAFQNWASLTNRLTWFFSVQKTLRLVRQIHQLPTACVDGSDIPDFNSPGMWPKSYEATLE